MQCPECCSPNDASFRFCQNCGFYRAPENIEDPPQRVSLSLSSIVSRLATLQSVRNSKPYQTQKNKLQQELERFLYSLPTPKSVYAASPQDITRFLVWKDHKGKTKIHIPACNLFGTKQVDCCACPTTLAAGTVDNLIGKLRSLFVELGRGRERNELLGIGNPASHPYVKQYLTSIREEQAQARVTPRQATPFFFDKLKRLCLYLRDHTFAGQISPTQRYLFARDLAFFCLDFFAGERASDLGRIFTREIMALPDGDGFLFHHTFGKTLRGKDANTFMIKKCRDPVFCPVVNLRLYVNLCDLMSIYLRDGHLFRSTDKKGAVSGKPFIGSAIANHLSLHLASLGIHYQW